MSKLKSKSCTKYPNPSVKITLWGSYFTQVFAINNNFIKERTDNSLYGVPEVKIECHGFRSMYTGIALKEITSVIDNCEQKQIHVICAEVIDFDECDELTLRLKKLFYFASLCSNESVEIIICDIPEISIDFVYKERLNKLYNKEVRNIIENCGIENISIFSCQSLTENTEFYDDIQRLTLQGCKAYAHLLNSYVQFRALRLIKLPENPVKVSNDSNVTPIIHPDFEFKVGKLSMQKYNFEWSCFLISLLLKNDFRLY